MVGDLDGCAEYWELLRQSTFVKGVLTTELATLVAILTKNNRQAEAKKVAAEVKKFDSDEKLSMKLNRAMDSVLTGTIPDSVAVVW